jgi:hypothetical protein
MEGGIHHCTEASSTSFKAAQGQNTTVMDTLTPQIEEVLALMKTYIGQCKAAREVQKKLRQSELSLLRAKVDRLMKIVELNRAYEVRRLALTLAHPCGFMTDLGMRLSDGALEAMNRVQEGPTEFNTYAELTAYMDNEGNRNSYLANPAKMNAIRLATMFQ